MALHIPNRDPNGSSTLPVFDIVCMFGRPVRENGYITLLAT